MVDYSKHGRLTGYSMVLVYYIGTGKLWQIKSLADEGEFNVHEHNTRARHVCLSTRYWSFNSLELNMEHVTIQICKYSTQTYQYTHAALT